MGVNLAGVLVMFHENFFHPMFVYVVCVVVNGFVDLIGEYAQLVVFDF